jgi:hypothetical protein
MDSFTAWNRRASDEAVAKARGALVAAKYAFGWKEKGCPGKSIDELVCMIEEALALLGIDTPFTRGFPFCPYCGKPIEVKEET